MAVANPPAWGVWRRLYLAGSLKMPFGSFLLASLTGVLAGTAQFILAGWLLTKGINQTGLWSSVWQIIQQYPVGVGIGVMLVGVGGWGIRGEKGKLL